MEGLPGLLLGWFGHGIGTPDVPSFFDWAFQRPDDVLIRGELPMFMRPSLQILTQCASSNGHVVAVNQLVLQQKSEDLCEFPISRLRQHGAMLGYYWGCRQLCTHLP